MEGARGWFSKRVTCFETNPSVFSWQLKTSAKFNTWLSSLDGSVG